MFIAPITFVGFGVLASSNPLKCVSMNIQEHEIRPAMVNINSNEPLLHLYSVVVNKCSDTCNDINDPYTKLYVLRVA